LSAFTFGGLALVLRRSTTFDTVIISFHSQATGLLDRGGTPRAASCRWARSAARE
jgi:hypothetical protein